MRAYFHFLEFFDTFWTSLCKSLRERAGFVYIVAEGARFVYIVAEGVQICIYRCGRVRFGGLFLV